MQSCGWNVDFINVCEQSLVLKYIFQYVYFFVQVNSIELFSILNAQLSVQNLGIPSCWLYRMVARNILMKRNLNYISELPRFGVEPESAAVFSGDSVSFSCGATGFPAEMEYQW